VHPKVDVFEASFVINPVRGPAFGRGHWRHVLPKSRPESLAELGDFSFAIHE
jgi:hypothetical protein